MTKESESRKKKILNIIIREYIATAIPVASEAIQRKYDLGVSPATVRNDMASLEEEGFITRPHTSAGCVPIDKGYRYYVQSIASDIELPVDEQYKIRDLFLEAAEEVEKWLKLAAALISHLVGNAALVTFPKAKESRFKHLELVSLNDFLALLILVFSEASLKQQMLTFPEPVTQDQLSAIANKLNEKYTGLSRSGISSKKISSTKQEKLVTDAILDIMAYENKIDFDESYMEGLRLMLSQPEFTNQEKTLRILELMEARNWLKFVIGRHIEEEKVNVIIGGESGEDTLKDLSLVYGRYGVPSRIEGTIGVIGPTRMDYARAISTVAFISEMLTYMVGEVYSGD